MTTKTAGNRTPRNAAESFGTARQSSRVGVNPNSSDGAVWQEKLVVCEGSNNGKPQVLVRSYYRNLETMEKVWDEPPSGAAAIVHATAEERQEFEEQRTQLELTLQMIPPEDEAHTSTSKPRRGIFGRFRRKSSSNKEVESSQDVHLQKAIARSIREQKGDATTEDMELAMALSMSAQQQPHSVYVNDVSEDEMFQRALARSQRDGITGRKLSEEDRALQEALERSKRENSQRREVPAVAALPKTDFSQDHSSSTTMAEDVPQFSEDELNLKMPAKPKFDQFDPYSKRK